MGDSKFDLLFPLKTLFERLTDQLVGKCPLAIIGVHPKIQILWMMKYLTQVRY